MAPEAFLFSDLWVLTSPVAEVAAMLMDTDDVLVIVMVSVVEVFPTAAAPKLSVLGLITRDETTPVPIIGAVSAPTVSVAVLAPARLVCGARGATTMLTED